MYRWIMYVSQDIPGNGPTEPSRMTSISEAREAYVQFCEDVMSDQCSASLYAYSADRWELAEQFRGLGIPLDYPDWTIERGQRNGVVLNRT